MRGSECCFRHRWSRCKEASGYTHVCGSSSSCGCLWGVGLHGAVLADADDHAAHLNGDMLCDVLVVVWICVRELCQGPRGMMVLRNLLASAWSRWKEVVTLATEHLLAQAYTKSKGTSKLPTEYVSLQTVAMHRCYV